ncbi:protein D7 [Drosophila innubila]|uniref:protein D7 n=1 Tax=Drosophila innubila TaxID=198719 RepID=UPI00148E023A|nr:protein D7 [Drosophila innubila]
MDEDQYGTCPYDKSHRIVLFRMPGHIIKCMRNYRGPPLAICKYNATHRLPKEQMDEHLAECVDYLKFHNHKNLKIGLKSRQSPPTE